jgi:hypothetical protein
MAAAAGAGGAAVGNRPTFNVKDPDPWGPHLPGKRSIKDWTEDTLEWAELSIGRGMTSRQACLTIIRQLQGEAKKIARRVPVAIQNNGGNADTGDGQGVIHRQGYEILVQVLRHKYGILDKVNEERATDAYSSIKRRAGQDLSEFLNIFELKRDEAQASGQVVMNIRSHARKLLLAAGYPHREWIQLLSEFGGRQPQTEQEYARLLTRMRYLASPLVGYDPGLRGGGHLFVDTSSETSSSTAFPTFDVN